MKEEFRELVLKGVTYEVSNKGNVRRFTKNQEYFYYKKSNTGGYVHSAGKAIHQLVAMAFLNHKPCGHQMVVHHIDSNPKNNNVENLEVITQSENILKQNRRKTSIYPFVHFCPKIKRFKITMRAEGSFRYFGSFKNEEDAGKVSELLRSIYRI